MMKISLSLMVAALILAASVALGLVPVAVAAENYKGEVWTWDEAQNTVTLRQGTETFRVKITPDQLATLRLHEFATVRGELDGPAPIEKIVTQAVPMQAVPRGSAEQSEMTGTVSAVDPKGLVLLDTQQGRLMVWAAPDAGSRFLPGQAVRLRTSVQTVEMVPETRMTGPGTAIQAPADPAASIPSEPGDYAVITGRVMAVNPPGAITVESPRGPVTVPVPDPSHYQPGMTVRARTVLQSR